MTDKTLGEKKRNYKRDFKKVMYQLAMATDSLNLIKNQMKKSKWRPQIKSIETANNKILTKYDSDFVSYEHAHKKGYL